MEMEKNELPELTELKDYLIENGYPQSFIELIELYYRNDLLTLIEW